MIKLDITDEQIERAKNLYKFDAPRDSITNGKGMMAGAIGEIITIDYLRNVRDSVQHKSTKHYDMIADGVKYEIKTKKTNSLPKPYYNCSVNHIRQECDKYVFVRLRFREAYILGEITREDFIRESTFKQKGESDGDNGFIFKADCYSLPIYQLREIK